MLSALDSLRDFSLAAVILRLFLAMLTGGMIGIERAVKHRPAGFRTYMLVCLGAALTMLISQYEYTMLSTRWADYVTEIGIKTDISRLGAQVINGIGFLGAGTIIITDHHQVQGLTTAAGLWTSACIGLAIGAGFYECVLFAFIIVFLCIYAFPVFDHYIQYNTKYINIYVEFTSPSDLSHIIAEIKSLGVSILNITIERGNSKQGKNPGTVLSIRIDKKCITHAYIISSLCDLDGVHIVKEV